MARKQQQEQQQHSLCSSEESEALMLLEKGSLTASTTTTMNSSNSTRDEDHNNSNLNRYDSRRNSSSSLREEAFADLRILPMKMSPENDDDDDDSDNSFVPLHEEVTLADMRTTFCEDLQNMTPGSMPQSVLIGTTIGVFCGLVAYVYYMILEYLLDFFWHTLPEFLIVPYVPEEYHWIWILLLGWTMAMGVGASVRFLGEPGDLSYTVLCVHSKAFIGMDHVVPMLMASQFSILGGGSLGPEAPLVAICASFAGFISRKVFGQTRMNIVRKHTLMGMACALAAFFGVPLGGSLFALEINNRFGIEYYEHTMEAIFSGTVCLCIFRALNHVEIGAIWQISPDGQLLPPPTPLMVIIGSGIGLVGALAAAAFAFFHQRIVMASFKHFNLLQNSLAIRRALIGATPMLCIGVVYPRTMFWGEAEFQVIATGAPADELPHVFPTTGLGALQIDSFWPALLIGVTKLVAISFTVAAGYRGGFIFPFFAAGAAFGQALCHIFPNLSPVIACLCMAAGINVAITRTALASTLILAALAGEANAIPPILAASITSMFATSYMPFIRSQVKRQDIGPTGTTPTTTPSNTPAKKPGKTWTSAGEDITGSKIQYGAI